MKNDDVAPSKPISQVDAEPPAPRICRDCCGDIPLAAKVCWHCNRHQNLFWQHFRVEQVGILVSFSMIIIAFAQLREASLERVAASEALKRVEVAEANVVHLNDELREQFKLVARLAWFQSQTRNEFGGERVKTANDEMEKELNAMFLRMLPDTAERARFLADLHQRLPPR